MKNILRILYLLLIFSCQNCVGDYETIPDTIQTPILSPSAKERKTKKIRLDNGLVAYIISDPQAEKTAVSLSVNAGSWDEPEKQLGLAHFLEHMLFMGTKKYPEEGSYSRFIIQHGGQTNAYTEDLYTTYVFDIDNKGFEEAVTRFSEFFKDPLLSPSGISREINAIMQEYAGHLQNNSSRRLMVYKQLANKKHPWSRFNIGNSETLKNATTEDLRKWYEENYSADRMHIVVYSSLPLPVIVKTIENNFSEIKNNPRNKSPIDVPLFTQEAKEKIVYIEPVGSERSLILLWDLPDEVAQSLAEKPAELVCFVLGHEGEGSLQELLRKEDLAREVACGAYRWNESNMALLLEIDLTEKGVKHPFEVVTRVFQTIKLLQEQGIPPYLFNEYKKRGEIVFQFPTREEVFKEVFNLSRGMRYEELSSFPEKTTIIQNYRPKLIKQVLDALTPNNLLIDLMATEEETGISFNRKEPWLKAHYAVKPVPRKWIETWNKVEGHPNLSLPSPNLYLPDQLSLSVENGSKFPEPILLSEDQSGKLYFASDHFYKTPQISWGFQIKTPAIEMGNAKKTVLNDLYVLSVKKQFNTKAYQAKLAGLEYELSLEQNAFSLRVKGFDEKASSFLSHLLDQMTHLRLEEVDFNQYKEELASKYRKSNFEPPYKHGIAELKEYLYKKYTNDPEKQKALETITFNEFLNHTNHLFNQTYVEAMLYGHMDENSAKEVWDEIHRFLYTHPYPLQEQPKREIVEMPENGGPYYLENKVQVKGNALLLTMQSPAFTFKRLGEEEIIAELLSAPFFEELRSKQQTAYLISNLHQEVDKHLFSLFLLESHTHDPRDLLARTELFLERFLKSLEEDASIDKKFSSIKQAMINKLQTPPENLKEMGKKLQDMAFLYDGDFQWTEKRIEGINKITLDSLKATAKNLLGKENKRRLAILVKGISSQGPILSYQLAPSLYWLKEKSTYEDEVE